MTSDEEKLAGIKLRLGYNIQPTVHEAEWLATLDAPAMVEYACSICGHREHQPVTDCVPSCIGEGTKDHHPPLKMNKLHRGH